MASNKLAFLAVVVLLLQASWCAMAQQGGTATVMTLTSFEQGNGGGGPAACDGKYHSDRGQFAAMPTQYYAGGSRCLKYIRITSSQNTSRSVVAEVMDECDCKDNVIATSKAVWDVLGIDTDNSEVPVTWADTL